MVFEGRKGFMAQWISVVMGHPTGWGSEAWKPGRSMDECEGPDRLIRGMSRSVITWRVCKFHHQDDRRFFWDFHPKYKPSWKPLLRGQGKHPQVFKDLGANAWIMRAREITRWFSSTHSRYESIGGLNIINTKGISSRIIPLWRCLEMLGQKTNSSPLKNMPNAQKFISKHQFSGVNILSTLLRTNSSPLPKLWRWIFIFIFSTVGYVIVISLEGSFQGGYVFMLYSPAIRSSQGPSPLWRNGVLFLANLNSKK